MILDKRQFSNSEFSLEFGVSNHIVSGIFYFNPFFFSPGFDFRGVWIEGKEDSNLAFIINWETTTSDSYTAFEGKINKEGSLLLRWILISEDYISKKRKSIFGSSFLSEKAPDFKYHHPYSNNLPFPLELYQENS